MIQDYTPLINSLTLLSPSAREGFIRDSINNPYFGGMDGGKWNPQVMDNLRNRNIRGDDVSYMSNGDIPLLEKGIEHVNKYFKPLNSNNVIIINHGLYPFITNTHAISKSQSIDVSVYKSNLIRLLNSKKLLDADFVANETLHHYIDSTSVLDEEGVIDGTFLTHYDDGRPLTNVDLIKYGCKNRINNEFKEALKDKKVIFVGGYTANVDGRGCLGSAICTASEVVGFENIYVIKGLMLDHPDGSNKPILSKVAWYDCEEHVSLEHTLTLDETLEMFGK